MKRKRLHRSLNHRKTNLPHCSAYQHGHFRDEPFYPFVRTLVHQLLERITIGPTSIKFALSLEGFGKAVLSLFPGGQSTPVGSEHQNALLYEPPLAKYGQKITKIRKTRAPDLGRKSQEVVSKIGFETPFSGKFPEARSGA